jgi:hypothetical protein
MNMLGNPGGTISPLVIGFTLERFGTFEPSLLLVAAMYVVAALGWLAVDPTRRLTVR